MVETRLSQCDVQMRMRNGSIAMYEHAERGRQGLNRVRFPYAIPQRSMPSGFRGVDGEVCCENENIRCELLKRTKLWPHKAESLSTLYALLMHVASSQELNIVRDLPEEFTSSNTLERYFLARYTFQSPNSVLKAVG